MAVASPEPAALQTSPSLTYTASQGHLCQPESRRLGERGVRGSFVETKARVQLPDLPPGQRKVLDETQNLLMPHCPRLSRSQGQPAPPGITARIKGVSWELAHATPGRAHGFSLATFKPCDMASPRIQGNRSRCQMLWPPPVSCPMSLPLCLVAQAPVRGSGEQLGEGNTTPTLPPAWLILAPVWMRPLPRSSPDP